MWCSSADTYVYRCQLSPVNARASHPASPKELDHRLGLSTERLLRHGFLADPASEGEYRSVSSWDVPWSSVSIVSVLQLSPSLT